MIREVEAQFQLYQNVHKSIDGLIQGLTEEDLAKKPGDGYNNIISLIAHLTLTEKRFLAGLSGGDPNIDIMSPFHVSEWDVPQILRDWQQVAQETEHVLTALTERDMDETGITMRSGDVLTKRQVITYIMIHSAHHRGQIPLIKRMLGL